MALHMCLIGYSQFPGIFHMSNVSGGEEVQYLGTHEVVGSVRASVLPFRSFFCSAESAATRRDVKPPMQSLKHATAVRARGIGIGSKMCGHFVPAPRDCLRQRMQLLREHLSHLKKSGFASCQRLELILLCVFSSVIRGVVASPKFRGCGFLLAL